jgi:SAM-dependent MidA family methyltransferase
MRDLCRHLGRGFILTLDYGFTATELYSPSRFQGTFSCYNRHRRDDNPLIDLGEKDMTAHLNFTLLMEEAEKAGWETVYFKDQHHALIEIAQGGFLQELEKKILINPKDGKAQAEIRQFKTLTHPAVMDTQFKFLLQRKAG